MPHPRIPSVRRGRFRLAAVAFATAVAFAATPPSPPSPPASSARPAAGAPDSPVTLTPFEVTAGSEVGYESSTAMSGTRTNESLANLPNSISVINAGVKGRGQPVACCSRRCRAWVACLARPCNMQQADPFGSRRRQVSFGDPSVNVI
jgi:hypothetical protein